MAVLSFNKLRQLCGNPQLDGQQMLTIVDSIFKPRYIVVADTTLTIGDDHRGAILRFTSASAITVTLPTTYANDDGFLFGFIQYGAGQITFASAGTIRGGVHSSAQYSQGAGELIDNGEWLMTGVSA